MSSSWHDFLFASLDHSGVMTVDKPPLALWVQALSVRVFGYHPLSILVPQALMGVASVALVYDLVRRRFGRIGGFVAGLALALTPITVAISRHNNPDALLVLCCVAALWCAVRALDAAPGRPSTRWLVLAGVCVGLGFETKMVVALVVVPGIAAAWLWLAPAARGRWHALGQLLGGGGAMLLVGGAWPALVELTPAADRPWVSGTSDNRVLSLIFEYNGLGRVDGQTGGPGGGGGGTMFGGTTGPLRLLNSALGGQAGWLLGFALVSAARPAPRHSPAPLATRAAAGCSLIGGAFATTAVLFSAASGIFHPYYVSLLAPFAAALVGAGAAELISGGLSARVVGPLAVAAGVACELVVRADYPGQLTWLVPVLIVVGALAALALLALRSRAARTVALATVPCRAADRTGDVGVRHARPRHQRHLPRRRPGLDRRRWLRRAARRLRVARWRAAAARRRLRRASAVRRRRCAAGAGGRSASSGAGPEAQSSGAERPGSSAGAPPGASSAGGLPGAPGGGSAGGPGVGGAGGGGGGPVGAPLGGNVSLTSILAYVKPHGGGTIAVASQSSAASSIITQERERGRDRRLLRARERRERLVARAGGPLGQDPLGARRTGSAAASAHGLPGDTRTGAEHGDGGGGEGVHEGDGRRPAPAAARAPLDDCEGSRRRCMTARARERARELGT